MHEPKPFASLTSGLLARKGGASPAMRRQAMLGSMPQVGHQQDDLGWNDMGHEAPRSSEPVGLTPMGGVPVAPVQAPIPIVENAPVVEQAPVPAVVEARIALAKKVAEPEPVAKAPVSRQQGAKAAFTLRLDPERHLRLRLACAVANRSAQQIVTDALDAYLQSQPQIDALAEQLPRPGGKTK
ncbi:MAG: hypothetical protein QHC67_11220 [Sphingobium sp.]|uniref:hypothetical protein n=1 Tax=Sphingobium sp. TaxID=1912891 RepID=UPI0029B40B42|nr:hypothetical protein [Sphingobium sp.]MDX3910378.1 hypothetical protein [Sphingobium sp.]